MTNNSKTLNERTLDRLHDQMDQMIEAIRTDDEQFWVDYYGGPEKYAEMQSLAQRAVENMDRRKNMTPDEIAQWAKQGASFICGGPDDDVEEWGRQIAIDAQEETLRLEQRALDSAE